MRTIGLVGGTSWHSTAEYYRNINQAVNDHFGNNTNPPLILFNLNQGLIHQYQRDGNWEAVADLITDGALRLQKAGAETIMFCANTPHKVYELVKERIEVPILHIADATSAAIKVQGINKVCFIGTKFTMEEDFITSRIAKNGVDVIVPQEKATIDELHRIIQHELTFGKINASSKQYVTQVLMEMVDHGAGGVILGCTEFPLMFSTKDLPVPVFNTTDIHSDAAVKFILDAELNN
jgi:aspartate racemase